MHRIGVITNVFGVPVRRLEQRHVSLPRSLGYDYIDVRLTREDANLTNPADITELMSRFRLPVSSVFALFDQLPAESHEWASSQVDFRVELARAMMATKILLGVGGGIDAGPRLWEPTVGFVQDIASRYPDVTFNLEIEPSPDSLLDSADGALAFLEQVDRPNCRLNLDIGHCWLLGIGPDHLTPLLPYVDNAHVVDNDGKEHTEWVPGRGSVPFSEYLQLLDNSIGLTVEIDPSNRPSDDLSEAIAHLRLQLAQLDSGKAFTGD